jgi:translation initiation factor 5B
VCQTTYKHDLKEKEEF